MEKMRALVANDPRVYRELISDAFRRLRPLVEVSAALPEELDEAVARVRPHLIICSRLTAAARAACLAWVVLYPDGEDLAEIGGAGGPHGVAGRCGGSRPALGGGRDGALVPVGG